MRWDREFSSDGKIKGCRDNNRGGEKKLNLWERWEIEPRPYGVADGISNRVDRIKCLGNAVVPQQFYPIFKAIAEEEKS